MRKAIGGVLSFVFILGCEQAMPQPAVMCNLGSLTGTWRTQYERLDGNCGPIPDEVTVVQAPQAGDAGSGACTYAAWLLSTDRCRVDADFTCPTNDGKGTQRWVGVYRQSSASKVGGTFSLQVVHSSIGTCRGTYNATITAL